MNYLITNNILFCSFLNTLAPYFKKRIIIKIGYLNYNLINSWIICILQTFNSSNNNNIELSNIKYLNYKETFIIFILSQITIYSSMNYSYLIENINVSYLILYFKVLETIWNLIFTIVLENDFSKNKIFGIIIISSGLIIYNK